jgi:hypothetical protein
MHGDFRWLATPGHTPRAEPPAPAPPAAPVPRRSRLAREGPRLEPLFPVGYYTPQSRCPHYGPIERGSVLCCMVCHVSGQDDHPALQLNVTAPKSREAHRAATYRARIVETRKQRRRRLFRDLYSRDVSPGTVSGP